MKYLLCALFLLFCGHAAANVFDIYRDGELTGQIELSDLSQDTYAGDNTVYLLARDPGDVQARIEAVMQARESQIQEAKPLEQKVAENAFFTLTETILASIEDPRAGETPPIKLSFAEINTLIKSIQAVDPMQAVLIAVELLSIDAELKRFDTLWWDKAATHVIQE